jgi:hypothetical protein
MDYFINFIRRCHFDGDGIALLDNCDGNIRFDRLDRRRFHWRGSATNEHKKNQDGE